jgi:hypothetical protein
MHARIEVFGNVEVGFRWRRISPEGVVVSVGDQVLVSRQEAHHSVHITQMPPYRIVDLWDRLNELITEEYNGNGTHRK